MMSVLSLQSFKVAVDGSDENGLLVLHSNVLVGVLVCLEEANYGNDQGHRHLEAGFGKCAARQTSFPKLEVALRWFAERIGVDPEEGTVRARAHLEHAGTTACH